MPSHTRKAVEHGAVAYATVRWRLLTVDKFLLQPSTFGQGRPVLKTCNGFYRKLRATAVGERRRKAPDIARPTI
jgi:hypothetical protein